jgi:hypothetical protein
MVAPYPKDTGRQERFKKPGIASVSPSLTCYQKQFRVRKDKAQ